MTLSLLFGTFRDACVAWAPVQRRANCTTVTVVTIVALALALATVSRNASAQLVINSSLVHEQESSAGSRYRGAIMVRNTASTPQILRIAIADFRYDVGKPAEYPKPNGLPRSNAGWITLDAPEVTIPANEAMAVGYTIVVPDSLKEAVGTYWSVLLLEGESAAASQTAGGLSVNTKLRHVVQVATHLGSSGSRKLEFADAKITDSVFSVSLLNRGTRGLRPVLRIEAYDADGVSIGTWSIPGMPGLIYPELSATRNVVIRSLKPGDYTIIVVADIGGDEVSAARFKVKI